MPSASTASIQLYSRACWVLLLAGEALGTLLLRTDWVLCIDFDFDCDALLGSSDSHTAHRCAHSASVDVLFAVCESLLPTKLSVKGAVSPDRSE